MVDDDLTFGQGVFGVLVAFVFGTVAGLYGTLVTGFVLSKLWLWHAVSHFGVQPIPWQQFGVLALAFGLLRYRSTKGHDDRTKLEKFSERIVLFVLPWIALAVGWVLA